MGNEIKPGMIKYCVVGNIISEHIDSNGITRHGTVSFPGGRKVYITRSLGNSEVDVLGLNRFGRYVYESVPLAWIENIRFSKTFKPRILELMRFDYEYPDEWWLYRKEDRIGAEEYARILNRVKAGDKEALDKYYREVMERYY